MDGTSPVTKQIDIDELRAELARRRWTRKELAERTGLSASYIGLVCGGLRPSSRAVDLIVSALGEDGAERVLL